MLADEAGAGAGQPKPCGICALIERCRAGNFADFIAELPHSFVILGNAQFYRGYCLLLAKSHVNELHLMAPGEASGLFDEMLAVGHAITEVTRPLKLNYECLGNIEPHVHWHVFPRYESDAMRGGPVWSRAEAERMVGLEETDRRELIGSLRAALRRRKSAARVA